MHSTAVAPHFSQYHFSTDDGLVLRGRIYGGPETSRPVICLAGLTRNSRDFHVIAGILAAAGRRVVTLDYRGRGLSDWDPIPARYNVLREAQDVVQLAGGLGITEADFIGTSRGGLILHFLPGMAPGLVRSVVLNDVGPVLEVEGLAKIRDYLSAQPDIRDFGQAARALKATHGRDFPDLTDPDWDDMAEAIYRDVEGRIVPDYDAALIGPLKAMDLSQPPPTLWEQFERLCPLPLLIIRGGNSRLLSVATLDAMRERHGRARSITAVGQGHAPLLHLPDIAPVLTAFLRQN
jgi:pimeloyl-ACP methyl ester carboxylesterase